MQIFCESGGGDGMHPLGFPSPPGSVCIYTEIADARRSDFIYTEIAGARRSDFIYTEIRRAGGNEFIDLE